MAFEFLSDALRGAVDFFGGLGDNVGNGRANREDDVRKVKRAMTTLGRMEEPKDGPSGIIDRPVDTAIRGFQRDKGLRVDGFMRPDGPTQRSLRSDLRGFLREEKESERDDGFDGLRSRSLNPAAALRGKRDSGTSDRDPEPSDRSFGLLETADRALSGGRPSDSGRDQDQPNNRPRGKGRDRLESNGSHTRQNRETLTTNDAPRLAPKETEPARLKPFLDKAERNLRRTVEGWRKEGMTDAAHHLEHFLDGTGEPIAYNRDQARSFGPIRDAEEHAQEQIRARILAEARTLEDGETRRLKIEPEQGSLRVRHGLGLLRGLLGDTDRLDDNLATGATGLGTVFGGTISRKGDEIAVDGSVEHKWEDRYDFHSGQPGADAALSVQRYRGAKPFEFGAVWKQRLTGKIERLLPKLRLDDVD